MNSTGTCPVLGRVFVRCMNPDTALGLDGGDTGHGAQCRNTVGTDHPGKDADPGQGGIGSKPERTAGADHLVDLSESIVRNGDGDPD
jgi:hypothetical protein